MRCIQTTSAVVTVWQALQVFLVTAAAIAGCWWSVINGWALLRAVQGGYPVAKPTTMPARATADTVVDCPNNPAN